MTLRAAINTRINIEEYLLWSTVISAFLLIKVANAGLDVMLGYPVILINSLILLVFDRLKIHRNHLIAILVLIGFSLLGMRQSPTPINAVFSQVLGIGVLSVYYFSALTTFGLTVPQWIEVYIRVAFAVAIVGLLFWPVFADHRLKAFYAEPSFYVYMTLPALGYCLNTYLSDRRYGLEALIFILSYILADSSLGYIGLALAFIFAFAHRLKGWQALAGGILFCILAIGLYFSSAGFQIRARDTAVAVTNQNLANVNLSTFALLSNLYVAGRTLETYPATGVGLGGYRYIYDAYIGEVTGLDLKNFIELNREDANSMFLRVAAELGIPGLIILFSFLIVCARVRGSPYREIRNALLPYLLVRIGRFGSYFSPELYFFSGLFMLNYLEYRKSLVGDISAPEIGGRSVLFRTTPKV
jgi:hypothetical protein